MFYFKFIGKSDEKFENNSVYSFLKIDYDKNGIFKNLITLIVDKKGKLTYKRYETLVDFNNDWEYVEKI